MIEPLLFFRPKIFETKDNGAILGMDKTFSQQTKDPESTPPRVESFEKECSRKCAPNTAPPNCGFRPLNPNSDLRGGVETSPKVLGALLAGSSAIGILSPPKLEGGQVARFHHPREGVPPILQKLPQSGIFLPFVVEKRVLR